jgi:hypothetical protein
LFGRFEPISVNGVTSELWFKASNECVSGSLIERLCSNSTPLSRQFRRRR